MTHSGVPNFNADRVLGHVIPGVSGVYDRYDYLKEKREAASVLASALMEIVEARSARDEPLAEAGLPLAVALCRDVGPAARSRATRSRSDRIGSCRR